MKIRMFACMLFALSFASLRADAASHAKRTPSPKPVTSPGFTPVSERPARENLIKERIRKMFGVAFADPIINDPRFEIHPPAEKPTHHVNRHDYSYVFTDWAMAKGPKFLEENANAFDQEEKIFGVPRSVVNAIFDIETQWGQPKTRGPVIISLYTLAVVRPDYVAHGWPEEQLMTWLTICKMNRWDPFSVEGSWTGAFGLDQEEPTSYLVFASACKSDGKTSNPFSTEDAICRIGNYLHRAGFGESRSSRLKAIWSYNHDPAYAKAVMDYADRVLPLTQQAAIK